jgi:type II secretory pathway component PulF
VRISSSDVADFYHQLGLLARSNLPLPESLRQLGQHFPSKDFQAVLYKTGERTARGEKFSDILQSFPQFFSPIHIKIIAAGEVAGTLPETLFLVARYARFWSLMTATLRDIAAYPLFTLHISLLIALYISYNVIPKFHDLFVDLLGAEHFAKLPVITNITLACGMFIHAHVYIFLMIYLCFLAYCIYVFAPTIAGQRALARMIHFLPGSGNVIVSLDSARICRLCSVFMKQGMPIQDALASIAHLVELERVQKALERVAEKVKAGTQVADALQREPAIDRLIEMAFRHCKEESVADELNELADIYENRVILSVRTVKTLWTAVATIFISLLVYALVLAMFKPLISVIRALSD